MRKIGLCVFFAFVMNSCHVGRFFIYNFSDIRDYKKFPSRHIDASTTPFRFKNALTGTSIKLPGLTQKGKTQNFEEVLQNNGTVAFLVIRHDSIIYEWTRQNYDSSSIVPSFSMAKSFVSAMIGIAIGEGKIKSTSEPITNYLPFLDPKEFGKITIQHLLDMQSGIHFVENYFNPFGDVAKYYYGLHLKKYMKHLRVEKAPGGEFEYLSLNTQLLAEILERATGVTPTAYLQDKLWSPLGMEFDASWSIDSKKGNTEKAFCCINARALDYAKFGRLFLRGGFWEGKQLVPADWVYKSCYDFSNRNDFKYTNQWWHGRDFRQIADTSKYNKREYVIKHTKGKHPVSYISMSSKDFFAQGHLGQFIYVHPKSDIIIVRLGKKEGKVFWPAIMKEISLKNAN